MSLLLAEKPLRTSAARPYMPHRKKPQTLYALPAMRAWRCTQGRLEIATSGIRPPRNDVVVGTKNSTGKFRCCLYEIQV